MTSCPYVIIMPQIEDAKFIFKRNLIILFAIIPFHLSSQKDEME